MKLKEARKLQNVFKSNLNEIWRGRYKSDKKKSALGNIKLLCKSREAVIKLFNDLMTFNYFIWRIQLYLMPLIIQLIETGSKF